MSETPGTLASRAVHQYRRRDIIAYVTLRQFLRNSATLQDIWSDQVAVDLVAERPQSHHNVVQNFKEIDESNGTPQFRILHVPGPTEMMAETALLAACARAGGAFKCPSNVYSYRLSEDPKESTGSFQYYFEGFKARHDAIAAACRANPEALVVYTDIRQYYPSITPERALQVWGMACKESGLSDRYEKLGEKLLRAAEAEHGHILTGPMISHLIGNLALRELDDDMAQQLPNGYFRYVDDIAIVTSKKQALAVEQRIEELLKRLGLEFNAKKRIEVPADRWLLGAEDFEREEQEKISWMTFIGDMKRLLVFYPEERKVLESSFRVLGIRIRPLDYSDVAQERDFLENIKHYLEEGWFRRSVRAKKWAAGVIDQAVALRIRYKTELDELLTDFEQLDGFDKKRRLYRLRFLIGRLAYLGLSQDLPEISNAISGIPEMAMASAVLDAITTRNINQILKYGPSAAQAAAQPLRAGGIETTFTEARWHEPEVIQAYAVLRLNGLKIEGNSSPPDDPLIRFCDWGENSVALFDHPNGYFREIGCIHGVDDPAANHWAIETAFDRDDAMVFDMQEIMQILS